MVDAGKSLRIRPGNAGAAGANNANTCFNWFNTEDITRDSGEAQSIREMIAQMAKTPASTRASLHHRSVRRWRHDLRDARDLSGSLCGRRCCRGPALRHRDQSARSTGRHVSFAVGRRGNSETSYDRRRTTVGPGRKSRSGMAAPTAPSIPAMPTRSSSSGWTCMASGGPDGRDIVDGYPRQTWWNKDGETSSNPSPSPTCRTARRSASPTRSAIRREGAFLIEAGISSSYHIAKFFGLTNWIDLATKKVAAKSAPAPKTVTALSPAPHLARSDPIGCRRSTGQAEPRKKPQPRYQCGHHPRAHRRRIDEVARVATHVSPVMNGLVIRSWPMLEPAPWPQMKPTSSPSGSSLVRIELISVA